MPIEIAKNSTRSQRFLPTIKAQDMCGNVAVCHEKIIIIACSLLPMIAERPQFYALTKVCVQLLIKRLLLPSCDYDKVIKGISFYPFDSAPNATLASLHSARNFIFDLFFICFKLNLHFVESEACIIKYAYIPRLLGCQKIFNKSARRGY